MPLRIFSLIEVIMISLNTVFSTKLLILNIQLFFYSYSCDIIQ